MHRAGYIYVDLKGNNITLLIKPIKYKKSIYHIILIDYGFCERFNKIKEKSPIAHGNACYASINSLSNNPISRKDDIIALGYFLISLCLGGLPWDNLNKEGNQKNNEIIALKNMYSPNKLLEKKAKEISFIFNDAIAWVLLMSQTMTIIFIF